MYSKENDCQIGITNVNTKFLGKEIVYYRKIDSTQKEIWRRVKDGSIDNGTVIMSDIQTDGIGTHGRKWYTTEAGNIIFSFVLYPNVSVRRLENLTVEIAEIIVTIFERIYQIKLNIKTPNDIMIGTKKIGGILTEAKLQGEIVKVLVIGIGINTNKSFFEEEISKIATSIKNEFHISIDNEIVIKEFCKEFENRYLKRLGKI